MISYPYGYTQYYQSTVDTLVDIGASRIQALPSVGYTLTYAQKSNLNPLFKYLRSQPYH